ncbi:hypothetical protein HPP92_005501 [Vanilla planifolia]|uniref:Uncharacterized protein n=1 Tax=Vanilla planifolia TaxID=51239 RepID=A0A835RZP1_VANPL|nr:hypothetical protein HPP92_005861 [Vanilla planifolia]KAG0494507.1 hypothetical protein HPP92_005501 [Vanilla planifolia]
MNSLALFDHFSSLETYNHTLYDSSCDGFGKIVSTLVARHYNLWIFICTFTIILFAMTSTFSAQGKPTLFFDSICLMSLLIIRSQFSCSFIFWLLIALLSTVMDALQLSSRENKKTKAFSLFLK